MLLAIWLFVPSYSFADKLIVEHQRRVSVEAVDEPLTVVLAHIGESGGLEVVVDPAVDKAVSVSVSNRFIKAALEKIARENDLNMIIGWQKQVSGPAEIVTVRVLANGQVAEAGSANTKKVDWYRASVRQHNKEKSLVKREVKKQQRADRRRVRQEGLAEGYIE